MSEKLPRDQELGQAIDSDASVLKDASTTHSSGTRKAPPITSITTVLAIVLLRSRGPFPERCRRGGAPEPPWPSRVAVSVVESVAVIACPPPGADAGTPARPRPRSGAAAAPRPCRSRAGRRKIGRA